MYRTRLPQMVAVALIFSAFFDQPGFLVVVLALHGILALFVLEARKDSPADST